MRNATVAMNVSIVQCAVCYKAALPHRTHCIHRCRRLPIVLDCSIRIMMHCSEGPGAPILGLLCLHR